ncbi:MAG: ABC transporter permease [Saprospiraceae bacterium]|nr:ABC transporter permease [Saprospiraceae bacterium]HMW38688.1 ABC transporter permease [Saprospiraceae bacterium]HMX87946.1 ABC transporter permease [Saprospiraceae bacterium]HMZ40004.1 ABC transporter permease [Saprospiraceae bacterium]HNA65644.1 ABC transporter permease [Saprospiraceae bacterium]
MSLTSIFYRLTGAFVSLMILSLVLHWMIRQIPGSYDDFIRSEDPATVASGDAINKTLLPLFYFSVVPDFNTVQKEDPASLTIQDILPRFRWNASNNIFHRWLFNNSNSFRDGKSVSEKVTIALGWTLIIQLPALLLIIICGFTLAEWSLRTTKYKLAATVTQALTILHSMPAFWLANLLLIIFAGGLFAILPSSLVMSDVRSPFQLWIKAPQYLILPVLCILLPSLSVIYQLVRRQMILRMEEPFWARLIASGISKKTGFRRELRPLVLIPLAAWFASAIPMLITGSLIIENIFSIPGTGRLLYQSIAFRDWPVAHALILLAAFMTILGIAVADLIQWVLDPRLRRQNSEQRD